MSKWESEKEELERLINVEKVSYEEIGRRYGCTGANIKKVAKRLGINLPIRNAYNTGREPVNKCSYKCLYCGKELKYTSHKPKFCNSTCQSEFYYKQYIEKWKTGEESGAKGTDDISNYVRKYLFEIHNNSCEKCGWNEVNPYTGRVPLQIHHLDGDCKNNRPENLQLLCPNCHSLTENFGSRNKNCTRIDKRVR